MTILKACKIISLKVHPKTPDDYGNWSVGIWTDNPAQRDMWVSIFGEKRVTERKWNEAPGWSLFIRKKSTKLGEDKVEVPAKPVKLVDGDLKPLDPYSIGFGSLANIEIWEHDYTVISKTTKKPILVNAKDLSGIQVYFIIPYGGGGGGFEKVGTTVSQDGVKPMEEAEDNDY